jgi:hypothetical protein
MTELRFNVDGESYAVGELVFHSGSRAFATVAGLSGNKVLINELPGGSEFRANRSSIIRDGVEEAQAFADYLDSDVDSMLADWFLRQYADGLTVEECRGHLRAALQFKGER